MHGYCAEGAPQTPRKSDSAAAAAQEGAEAEPGPLAAGPHGIGSAPKEDDAPVLAPASQLGPGFVATPEKPAATEEAPKPSLLSGEAPDSGSDAAAVHRDAETEGSSMQEGTAQPDVQSIDEAAVAPQVIATEEPASVTGTKAAAAKQTPEEASQPDEKASLEPEPEPEPEQAPFSSLHVASAPSKALDAAEKGESPMAPAAGAADEGAFTHAIPDAKAVEQAQSVLEDNVKAMEAATDDTADTLEAGLNAKAASAADTQDKAAEQAGGHSESLASGVAPAAGDAPRITAEHGGSAGSASAGAAAAAAAPATGAPEEALVALGGFSGLTRSDESAGDARAPVPAITSPELQGTAAAGQEEAAPDTTATEPHLAQPAGEAAAADKAAEPATGDAELLGVAGAGEKGAHNLETAGKSEAQMPPPMGQATGAKKATEPAVGDLELLGVARAGEKNSHSEEAQAARKPESQAAMPAIEGAAAEKAAEPATGDIEILGVAGAGDEGAHSTKAQAAGQSDATTLPPGEGSGNAYQTSKHATDTSASSELNGRQGAAKETSASSPAEARAVADITQAAAQTPGDAKAAEPAEDSLEFLGAAKATDAASEPVAPAPAAVDTHAAAAEGVCTFTP